MTTQIKTHKRVNITLPQETLHMIDKKVKQGDRSRLIDKAVRFYIDEVGKEKLREQLKEGALARSKSNGKIAHEWFQFEEEVWQKRKTK
jgi:CopG family transcriptional regulator / antitoxin EndoAI